MYAGAEFVKEARYKSSVLILDVLFLLTLATNSLYGNLCFKHTIYTYGTSPNFPDYKPFVL